MFKGKHFIKYILLGASLSGALPARAIDVGTCEAVAAGLSVTAGLALGIKEIFESMLRRDYHARVKKLQHLGQVLGSERAALHQLLPILGYSTPVIEAVLAQDLGLAKEIFFEQARALKIYVITDSVDDSAFSLRFLAAYENRRDFAQQAAADHGGRIVQFTLPATFRAGPKPNWPYGPDVPTERLMAAANEYQAYFVFDESRRAQLDLFRQNFDTEAYQ